MDRGDGWYKSERRGSQARFEIRFSRDDSHVPAAPGSIEEFLVERYAFYSRAAGPLLWRGPVRHEPWLLGSARMDELDESLSTAAGLRPLGRPDLCHWSPGVAVEFERFRLV
jgi:uncharacterized protein YqjF (DUF2071 family)